MSRSNGSGRRGSKKEQLHTTRALEHEIRTTRNGVSANHLLNFSLPERDKQPVYTKKKTKSEPTRTQNEFLHANFRFVVSPLEDDATTPFWDMEALTEWKNVEQVLLWHDAASPMSCPICLDAFRAPKITKCGHIFCWPCILRYLSLSDKYWRRCPMCFESVQKGQLRSVELEALALPPRIDADATFQLLARPKASYFPYVAHSDRSAGATSRRVRSLPSVNDPAAKFARILEATSEYVTELLVTELRDLEALDAECRSAGDADSLPFITEAMRATSGRLAQSECRPSPSQPAVSGTGSDCEAADTGSSDVYSFYQLSNGLYVVLHPLNMKCLLKEFTEPKAREAREASESKTDTSDLQAQWTEAAAAAPLSATGESPVSTRYDQLPEVVSGRVLDVEHVVMDDDMCKRYRFLSHLPRFCDFYLCELDLTPLLSPATLDAFRPELKKRERQRKQKRKSEQRRTTPSSSPAFPSRSAPGFSIEQDGLAWPAPADQALADALEASLVLNGSGGGTDDSEWTDRIGAGTSAPTSPAFSGGAFDDDGSFATVTRQSGYYPPLGSSTGSSERRATSSSSPSPLAWGTASSAPPLFDLDLDALPRTKSKGKKGAGGKKGVALFSTSQHRSYR